MDTKDKFYKFNGSFIKVSSIYQMSCLFVFAENNTCHGSINEKKYEHYVVGLSSVPYLDRPDGLLEWIEQDGFCMDYLNLYKAFLKYNNLESETICFDSIYSTRIFPDEVD